MGFRFSRRIRIAKGLRLNVSKSGLGLSVGPRGASFSFGPRGAYGNLGIPGTGLSLRGKLGGASPPQKRTSKADKTVINVKAQISIDDETGKETITVETDNGTPIYDESILRKVKKTEAFKEKLLETRLRAQESVAEKSEKLINIYKSSSEIISLDEVQERAQNLKPETYTRQVFEFKQPDRALLEQALTARARREIKSWKFWKLKNLRNDFVTQNIDSFFSEEIAKWQQQRSVFELEEDKREAYMNTTYIQQFKEQKLTLERIIGGDDDYIQSTLGDILSHIQLPVEFNINYKIGNSVVEVDLDLPEIEHYPINKAEILQSGKLSIKKKAKADLNRDYAKSVLGLSFYFGSIIFNISPAIHLVKISGYTQRLNKKSGKVEDQYVYSINFDRWKFASLNIRDIDPILAVENFEHKKEISAVYELRTISI